MHPSLPFPTANTVLALQANLTTNLSPSNDLRRSSSSSCSNFLTSLNSLITFARLAQVTYCASNMKHNNNTNTEVIVPVGEIPGVTIQKDGAIKIVAVNRNGHNNFVTMYDEVSSWENNSVWLFRPREPYTKAEWVVAFRGSLVDADDIFTDLKLVAAVASGEDSSLRSHLDEKFGKLKKIFAEKNITRNTSLLLVGHSLGGVLAEAMSLYLHQEQYTSVSAVAFDTPGLPHRFRESFGSSATKASRRLTLVYGDNNLVNNLAPAPREATCFRVREYSSQGIPSCAKLIWSLRSPLRSLKLLASRTYRLHYLANIADLLEKGKLERDSQTANRQLVGQAIRIVYETCLTFVNMVRCVAGKLFTGDMSAYSAKLGSLLL